MRKILIGTPTYDGKVQVEFANALRLTERLCASHDIELTPVYLSYDALVQRARNDLVQIALEGGFDDLMFIDADIEWQAEGALAIMQHPVDCVGATYRKKTDSQELYTVKSGLPVPVDIKTGLWIVEGLGTGFLRISRKALQALWDASEAYTNEGKTCRWIFDVCPVNGSLVGEDMMMCQKLRELGFSIYLDPSFTPLHIGMKKYFGDFASYIELLKKNVA